MLQYLILTAISRPRLPQDLRSPRKGPPMDRGQAEPPRTTASLCVRGSEDIWSLWRASFYKPRGGSTGALDLLGIYAASGDFRMRQGSFPTFHVVCILSVVCMFIIRILVRNLNDYQYCQGSTSGIAIVRVAQVVAIGGRIFMMHEHPRSRTNHL